MSILGLSRISCHVSLTLNHVDGKIILIVVIFVVVVVVVGVVVGDAVATWGLTTIFPIEPYCLFLFRLFGTWKFPRSRTPSESQTCSRCAAAISFSFVVFLDTLGYRHFSKLLVEPRVVYLNPQHSTARVLFSAAPGVFLDVFVNGVTMPDFFHWFLAFVLSMLFTGCFFHVASILLHFGSWFFSTAAVFRSGFPQALSFRSGPCLSFGFVSVVLSVFSRCLLASLFFFHFFPGPGGMAATWRPGRGISDGLLLGSVWYFIYIYIYSIRYRYNLGSSFFPYLGSYFLWTSGWWGGGGDCLKNGTFEGKMKGETLAKFLRYIFVIFFGHVGAGGPAVQINNIFLKILLVEAFLPW